MLQLPVCAHEDLLIPLLQHYFVEVLTHLGYPLNLIDDGIDPFEIDAGNNSLQCVIAGLKLQAVDDLKIGTLAILHLDV